MMSSMISAPIHACNRWRIKVRGSNYNSVIPEIEFQIWNGLQASVEAVIPSQPLTP